MGRKGRKQRTASKPAKTSKSAKSKTGPPDSELEEGEVPETDYEESTSTSANTTPERDQIPELTEDPQLEGSPSIDADGFKSAVEKTGGSKPTEETEGFPSIDADSVKSAVIEKTGNSKVTEETKDYPSIDADGVESAVEKTGGSKPTEETEGFPSIDADNVKSAVTEKTGDSKVTEETKDSPSIDADGVESAVIEKTGGSKLTEETDNGHSRECSNTANTNSDTQAVQKTGSSKTDSTDDNTAPKKGPTIEVPVNHAPPLLDPTMTSIWIGNLTRHTTEEEIGQVLGVRTTPFLRKHVRIKLYTNSKEKSRSYAIINGPKHILDKILPLNGKVTLDSRTLIIEPVSAKNSITPYNPKKMRQGRDGQNRLQTSEDNGELRPASRASSRQEGSVSSTNRAEDESGEIDSEEVGGGKTQHATSMAQVARDGHNRQLMEERRRCQLLMDIFNDDEGAPPPCASMVYKIVTEKLGLSDDPSNGVNAIYRLDPSNPWKWFVLFISENLKNSLEDKEGTIELTHKEDKIKYTYYFKTRKSSVPAKSIKPLMITVQSSPLISHEELGSYLQPFGKIQAIVAKKCDFAKHVDTGLRLIFITLNPDVKARDLPIFLSTSDGVRRKLYFKGKLYICRDCGTKHTFTEGCPPEASQQDQPEHEQNVKITETTNIPQQIHNTETCGRNRTHSPTRKHTNTTQEYTNTTQQPNKQQHPNKNSTTNTTRDKNDKRVEDMRAGTPMNTEEVDFPLSPGVISKTPFATPVRETRDKPSFSKNREIDKLTKSVDKVKTKILSTPQRKVKPISPCCISDRPPFRF